MEWLLIIALALLGVCVGLLALTLARLSRMGAELGATMDQSVRQMAAAYELWDFGMWSPIIRSTVYEGLYCVGNAVLEGTFRTAESRRGLCGKKEQV